MAQTLGMFSKLPDLDELFLKSPEEAHEAECSYSTLEQNTSPESDDVASELTPPPFSSVNQPATTTNDTIKDPTKHPLYGFKKQKSKPREKPKDKNRNVVDTSDPSVTIGEPNDTTRLIHPFLPAPLSSTAFALLKSEVAWRKMHHRGGEVPRLVAVQGSVNDDGSYPIYRHPSDESPPLLPFSKTVEEIRKGVESVVGHKINHVLIQWYRGGGDYISEHSDKTLDIKRGSSIVNVSLGAQRVMTLRTKKPPSSDASIEVERKIQKIPLPHNSIFVLGLDTNQKWTHAINRDLRPDFEKNEYELMEDGGRISLTFRLIDTFLSKDEEHIWGQGAKSKTQEGAGRCVSGEDVGEPMLIAFGKENGTGIGFDWEENYGDGFDVLHMIDKAAVKSGVEVKAGDEVTL